VCIVDRNSLSVLLLPLGLLQGDSALSLMTAQMVAQLCPMMSMTACHFCCCRRRVIRLDLTAASKLDDSKEVPLRIVSSSEQPTDSAESATS
jgi:hypothetical protein